MLENGFNKIVVIQAVDTTDNTVVNLCMSRAIDNGRGIVLLNKEKVCKHINSILYDVSKEDVTIALNDVLRSYKSSKVGIYELSVDVGLQLF